MKAIETHSLTKYYGKSRGIENVDLTVEKGDFFGFIGPNGAGKSTFIRTVLGLISSSGGAAEVLGLDIKSGKTEILRRTGYLPSETVFYSGMRVSEALELSARLRKKDCRREAKLLCERLELDVRKRIGELSLGNRKKAGIVCALQHEPELYIMDEATSGLDPLMQKEFFNILKEKNEKGATVFLSSHILSEVARYCKRAAVIRDGSILACDSIERLSQTEAKRVVLRGISAFDEFEGARDIKREGDSISFLYSGRYDLLIKKLSTLAFNDINITDPELDEVFMHYYEKEEK